MKSEERHQLAQNDLQVGINRWLEKIEPYSNHILGGIVAATVVAVGLILWTRSRSSTSETGWSEMASARTADRFLEIAEENPGSAAANWARLQAARISYSNGIETALTDRKSSDESLKQAKDVYKGLVNQNTMPELREEALKGYALTLESTSGSDVGDAIKAYEQLIKEFPDSTFRDFAAHRVEELKNPDAGEFYAWFRKQNPKPAARPLPNDGKLPIEGAIKAPDLPEINLNAGTEKPKADTSVPALPAVPATEGKSPPTTPAGPVSPPPTTTAPVPMPEATKPTVPMPMPEAPEKTVPMPMPEASAKPAPLPDPTPKTPVEPPKAP
jgi:hypothetical protein